ILHGVENWRPLDHWQWWLANELRSRGEQVLYPQLPSPSSPALDQWLAVLHGELAQLGSGERIVVAHSCSVALWLLAAPEIASASSTSSSAAPDTSRSKTDTGPGQKSWTGAWAASETGVAPPVPHPPEAGRLRPHKDGTDDDGYGPAVLWWCLEGETA